MMHVTSKQNRTTLSNTAAGAGKFLEVLRIFVEFPQSCLKNFFSKIMKTSFGAHTKHTNIVAPKQCLHVFIFHRTMRTEVSKHLCARIFRDFAQICDKSNFWWCACTSASCRTGFQFLLIGNRFHVTLRILSAEVLISDLRTENAQCYVNIFY